LFSVFAQLAFKYHQIDTHRTPLSKHNAKHQQRQASARFCCAAWRSRLYSCIGAIVLHPHRLSASVYDLPEIGMP